MSSFLPRRIKEEPLEDEPPDDISHVASDSEIENDFDCGRLQPIDSEFANDWKYPIGCMVWYGARKSKKSKIFRAKSGTVIGVFLNLEDNMMQKGYKVKSDTSDDEHHEIALYEDKLVYGMNCPVTVKDLDSNREVDGVIVCPKLEDDQNKVSYVVKFSEGRRVKMEFLVANERVSYREVDETNIESIGQKSNGGEEDEKKPATAVAAKKESKKADALQEQKNASEKEATENKEVEMKQPATTSTAPAAKTVAAVAPNDYAMLAGGSPFTVRPPVKHVERESGTGLPSERNIASRWSPPTPKKTLERKRSYELDVGSSTSLEQHTSSSLGLGLEREERPKKKMAKTEADEAKKPGNDVTCTLTIPSWVYNIDGQNKYELFYHLIGSEDDGKGIGYKHKLVESRSGCKVHLSGKHDPIKIDITSSSSLNVGKGISMIEESLVDFISDENSSIRMLYELMLTATGSFKIEKKEYEGCRVVRRVYNGVKNWSVLFDLPYSVRGGSKQYHGKFLTLVDLPMPDDCIIEVFGDDFDVPLAHTSPFALIRGIKLKDVTDVVLMVRDKMKRHQGRGCGCVPKW